MKVVCRKYPTEIDQRQRSDLVRNDGIRIPVDRRNLISFGVNVGKIASELDRLIIPGVNDTRIIDLQTSGRLEIYVLASQKLLKECLEL